MLTLSRRAALSGAMAATQRAVFQETAAFKADSLGLTFQVPMVFFQGEDDLNTPTALVREYKARIRAPLKRLVLIPGADHMAIVFHDRLLELLDTHVRPLALASAPS